jgi:hypothetical protein
MMLSQAEAPLQYQQASTSTMRSSQEAPHTLDNVPLVGIKIT